MEKSENKVLYIIIGILLLIIGIGAGYIIGINKSNVKVEEKEKVEEKKEKEETPKKEEKERKESFLSYSRRSEPEIDLENNEKIKEIISRIEDVEKSVKIIPNQLGIEQIKLDISTLKSGIRNFALANELKETKEKEEDIQKQLNFLKEQFEDFI